jgi:hypothetical protein
MDVMRVADHLEVEAPATLRISLAISGTLFLLASGITGTFAT